MALAAALEAAMPAFVEREWPARRDALEAIRSALGGTFATGLPAALAFHLEALGGHRRRPDDPSLPGHRHPSTRRFDLVRPGRLTGELTSGAVPGRKMPIRPSSTDRR